MHIFIAVSSLSENKKIGHHHQAMFVPIFAFLLFVVSVVVHGGECALSGILAYYSHFFCKFCRN